MSANDRGAVTAEFMMLMPAMISVVAIVLAGFQLAVESIALERDVVLLARQLGYGMEISADSKYSVESWREEEYACVALERGGLIPLRSQQCVFRAGS